MTLINSYASQLEIQCNIDSNDAFGMALDSFVRGIERCHSMIATQITSEEKSVAIEQVDDVDTDDEEEFVKVDENETKPPATMEVNAYLVKKSIPESTNLASLLQIPRVHTDEEDRDIELVEQYAEELQEAANLDAAIAYGIALDSFIADPIEFRKHVGKKIVEIVSKMNSPTPEIMNYGSSLRSLFQLPDDYNDEEDRDIEMVEQYAKELQHSSHLDSGTAYSIALDSFIADPIEFRKHIGKKIKSIPEIMNYGSSLRLLFQLPSDYNDEEDRDIEMVEQYAEELQEAANLDAAIAYGIALDSFIADPIEFRKHMGSFVEPTQSNAKTPASNKKETPKSAVKSAVKIVVVEEEEVKTVKTPVSSKKSTPKSAAKNPVSSKKATAKSSKSSSESEVVVVVVEEEEEEEIVDVILCDDCDGEFELEKLKISEIPDGDWYCPECEKKRAKPKERKRKNIVDNVVNENDNVRRSSRRK
jgi:hypothetical protein